MSYMLAHRLRMMRRSRYSLIFHCYQATVGHWTIPTYPLSIWRKGTYETKHTDKITLSTTGKTSHSTGQTTLSTHQKTSQNQRRTTRYTARHCTAYRAKP